MGFDWDDDNIEHVARPGIEPGEIEEAATDPRRVVGTAHRGPGGERRVAVVGTTAEGRILSAVLERRGTRFRIVTARDAQVSEKRRYRR